MGDKVTFTLAVQLAPPYLLFNEEEETGIVLRDGPDVQVLKSFQEKYGFHYNITLTPDGEWGNVVNNTWTGLIGMINRTEADIAAGCISMTYLRRQAVDFTYPFTTENGVIISKKPMTKSKVCAVIMPFTKEVWALILFALVVKVFIVQHVVKRHAERNGTEGPTLSRTFWYMFGLLCNEAGHVEMFQSTLASILIGLWLMFVVVIQSSYSGTLMSFLSIPGRETSIDTLADLANAIITQEGFQCGYLKGSNGYEILKHFEGQLSVISKTVLENPSNSLESVDEGFTKILSGNFAFLSQKMASSYIAHETGVSDFHMGSEAYGFELVAFAVRRNFPYKKQFDETCEAAKITTFQMIFAFVLAIVTALVFHSSSFGSNVFYSMSLRIRRLTETGLIEKWKKDKMYLNSKEKLNNEILITALSITELHGALVLCGYGYSLSVFVFLIEKCYVLYRSKKMSTH